MVSLRYEKLIYELIVQVLLLFINPNLEYCTLYASELEFGQMNRRTIQLVNTLSAFLDQGHKNRDEQIFDFIYFNV